MEKRVERLGNEVTLNPPGYGDWLYASAAKALKIETQSLKKVVFDFLKSHQFDVSIQRHAREANKASARPNLKPAFKLYEALNYYDIALLKGISVPNLALHRKQSQEPKAEVTKKDQETAREVS